MSPDLASRAHRRRWTALAVAGLAVTACSSAGAPESVAANADPVATAEATAAAVDDPVTAESVTEEPVVEDGAAPVEQVTPAAQETTPEEDDSAPVEAAPSALSGESVEVDSLEGVLTDVVADAQGGRAFFDGTVNEEADLEDLVADAWGDGGLGLHRGHAQVENVLEAFLGIDHDAMHDYMDQGLNLAATAEAVGQNPEALVASLTNSYIPFINQGVDNGVITTEQANGWIELLRTEFNDRVYWDGISDS